MSIVSHARGSATLGLLLGVALCGCHGSDHGSQPATSAPAQPPAQPPAAHAAASPPAARAAASPGPLTGFTDASADIRFQYPSTWKTIKGATAVLTVVAPPAAAGGGFASLFLDVPKVPTFAGALLSAKAVADGYVNDVKKNRIPDASEQSKDVTVAGVSAKDVTLSGKETGSAPGLPPVGSQATEEAICLVRKGKIYIFSCDSDEKGTPAAHAALEAAVQSVQWTR